MRDEWDLSRFTSLQGSRTWGFDILAFGQLRSLASGYQLLGVHHADSRDERHEQDRAEGEEPGDEFVRDSPLNDVPSRSSCPAHRASRHLKVHVSA